MHDGPVHVHAPQVRLIRGPGQLHRLAQAQGGHVAANVHPLAGGCPAGPVQAWHGLWLAGRGGADQLHLVLVLSWKSRGMMEETSHSRLKASLPACDPALRRDPPHQDFPE